MKSSHFILVCVAATYLDDTNVNVVAEDKILECDRLDESLESFGRSRESSVESGSTIGECQ